MEFVKKHKKQIVVISLMCLGVVVGVAFYQSTAQAAWWEFWKPSGDDEKAAADFLGKYGKYLQYSDNPIKSMLHTLGWGMVTLFYHIVTLIEDCLDGANLLSLFSFVDGKNATIHGIYGSVMNVVVWSVLALSLVLVGYKLMVGKQSDLKNLTVNIFLSIGLLVLMPTLFGVGQFSGQAFSKGLFNDVKALNTSDKKPNESLAFGLIKQNCTDWAYVSQKNKWDDVKKDKSVNQLDEKDFSDGVYPLNNLITSKSASEMDTKQGKLLQYHLSKDDDNKTKPVKDASVASWAPKVFKNGYFQYTLTSTIGVLVGLAALAIAVLFNAFVIVRAIVELAMKRILAPVIFASDIETLQKSKMILSDIMKCYLTIGLTELGMVLFNFWVTYVNGKNMNLLLKVVCFVAGVSFLINGSTSVQRYFGIDIGLQDGKNGWMAAFGVGAAIGKGSKSVKSAVENVTGTTVAGIAGGAAGIMNGLQKASGMKLSSQVNGSGSGGSSATAENPSESLSERQNQQRHQDSKQKPENTNIQARKPSLARRAARATGQKIQQSAERQMQKHPAAAKIGGVAGTVAGAGAGLGIRAGKKLSGMNQRTGSQQTGGTTGLGIRGTRKLSGLNQSQARSDAVKVGKPVNNVNNDPLKRPDSSLSQKVAFNEAKNENHGRSLGKETASSVQGQQSDQKQESTFESAKADEEEHETLSENQDQFDSSKEKELNTDNQETASSVQEQQSEQNQESTLEELKTDEEVNTGDQETASSVQGQQLDQNQESSLENAKAPVKAAGQPTEATEQRPSQRQAETHDYSQVIQSPTGGSPTTTRQTSVQQSQVQKRPETPRERQEVTQAEVRQQASQPMEATQVQTEAVEQQSTVENPSENSTITATAGQTSVQHQQAQEYQQPEVHQVETRTEAPQTQQPQERQEVHQQTVQQEVQVQEAAGQRTEAPVKATGQQAVQQQTQTQQAQERQEQENLRTETPQASQQKPLEQQQEVTPAGTHDYSQIINGGSHTTTTEGSQVQSVQTVNRVQQPETTTTATGMTGSPVTKTQSVQPTETKQSTVQKRKRPGTPPTKPDGNVLKNPWSNVDNDRS